MSTSSTTRPRRKSVIWAGLLCGILAIVVTFSDRRAVFSPLAVVIVAAVGTSAVLLQLRNNNREKDRAVHPPVWLSIVGVGFAVAAVLSDNLHFSAQTARILALVAVLSFAISSAIILQAFRKQTK